MTPYVELSARSAFSFLEAASAPERLVDEAARLELPALALVDVDGVYGAPRFHKAAQAAGVRPLVGTALTLADGTRLALLVESRAGYQGLGRLVTRVKARGPKGRTRATWDDLDGVGEGLVCLTGGLDGPLTPDLLAGRREAARATLARLVAAVGPGRLYVELQRHGTRESELVTRRAVALARAARLPVVATGGVQHATPGERPVLDVLTAVRLHRPLDALGRRLPANAERHLRPPAEMARRFADLPEAVAATGEIAARCGFTLEDLGYRFPAYPVPDGRPQIAYLRELVDIGARGRYRPVTARVRQQLARELRLIEKLDLAGYFLIVWDIVREARARGILVQGRGSAANSAVCYSLGITAVDPVGMDLLFERFLSEERGEWPDIDLDLPSGERREAVIQYVYRRYGGTSAAMTANVITYQPRRAVREVGQALGLPPDFLDRLAKGVPGWGYHDPDEDTPTPPSRAGRRGPRGRADPPLRRALAGGGRAPAPPRPAFGGHGARGGPARRGGAARAGDDAGPGGRPVGQGRLRRSRDHQGRSPRPRDAGRARGGDHALPGRRPRGGPRASPPRRPGGVPAPPGGGHGRALPGREPGPDGDAPAPSSPAFLRPGRPDRDHPPGADHRADGPSVSRAAGGAPAGHVPASLARADPPPDARRAALPGAAPPDGDGRRRPHGRGGRGAPPGLRVPALTGAHAGDRGEAPRRDRAQWHHRPRGRGDRPGHHRVRGIRLPGEPQRELRAPRLRERVPEGPPSGRVLRGAPQQPADGLLSPRDRRPGRDSARPGDAPGGRGRLGVARDGGDRRGAARARAGQGAPRGGGRPAGRRAGAPPLRVRGRPLRAGGALARGGDRARGGRGAGQPRAPAARRALASRAGRPAAGPPLRGPGPVRPRCRRSAR